MIHRLILRAAALVLPLGVVGQQAAFAYDQAPVTAGYALGFHLSWTWIIIILALGAVLVQNIVRLRKRPGGSQEEKDQWHRDPANWTWGVFYHNKKDPRLFPPKRTYLGWTVNFANPTSIVAMALLCVVLLVLLGVVRDGLK